MRSLKGGTKKGRERERKLYADIYKRHQSIKRLIPYEEKAMTVAGKHISTSATAGLVQSHILICGLTLLERKGGIAVIAFVTC